MFWNRPAQKQPEPEPESRQQVLYYAQTPLEGDLFAVIRVTWHDKGMALQVIESQLIEHDYPLGQLAGQCLKGGADVSIICAKPPEAVGIEQP